MGHIKLDELSTSLKEYIANLGLTEEQVNELIQNVTGDMSTLQTTEKTVAGAINELFQSANNGKELIATAIGEPLNSSDTFSAMSNGINNLNSQFKSALMNNGVSVESADKFKQLIEKLALLADSECKGIQYASGTITSTSSQDKYYFDNTAYFTYCYSVVIEGLNFKPSIIYICANYSNGIYVSCYNSLFSNKICTMGKATKNNNSSSSCCIKVNDNNYNTNLQVYSDGFCLPVMDKDYEYSWYVIGVGGEEDTTLEDSLKSILSSKGVEVTEEDDLASLISKVDSIPLAQGNAVEANVLSGKTFTNADGTLRTGSMVNNGSKTFTPAKSSQTGSAGYYSGITVKGDSNLVAANIISGKSIFGVNGSAKTVVTGKVSNTSSNKTTFTSTTGETTASRYYVSINLSFNPTMIILFGSSSTTSNYIYYSIYKSDNTLAGFYQTDYYSNNGYTYKTDSNIKLGSNKFRIPVESSDITFTYYAF